NSLGLNDMGCRPDRLPGYAPLDAENAGRFSAAWTVDPARPVEVPTAPGLSYPQMLDALAGGTLKALWVAGANPVIGAADPGAALWRRQLQPARRAVLSGRRDPDAGRGLLQAVAGRRATMALPDRRAPGHGGALRRRLRAAAARLPGPLPS